MHQNELIGYNSLFQKFVEHHKGTLLRNGSSPMQFSVLLISGITYRMKFNYKCNINGARVIANLYRNTDMDFAHKIVTLKCEDSFLSVSIDLKCPDLDMPYEAFVRLWVEDTVSRVLIDCVSIECIEPEKPKPVQILPIIQPQPQPQQIKEVIEEVIREKTPKKINNSKEINVLMVENSLCTRAIKEALALKSHVGKIVIISRYTPDNITIPGITIYNTSMDGPTMAKHVEINNINVIHCHNFPDEQALTAIQLRKKYDISVIHDSHELGYLKPYSRNYDLVKKEEEIANKQSDGRVYVSYPMLYYYMGKYDVDINKSIVLHSMPSTLQLPKKFEPRLNDKYLWGVYEGGMGGYRDSTDDFSAIAKRGAKIDVYPTFSAKPSKLYNIKKKLPYAELIQRMAKYDFGIIPDVPVGVKERTSTFSNCTNKLWDYIASGLPVLCNYGLQKSHRDIVESNYIGGEISNGWNRETLEAWRKNVALVKHKFVMENHIHKLVELYKICIEGVK